jgi:hypothetical protein
MVIPKMWIGPIGWKATGKRTHSACGACLLRRHETGEGPVNTARIIRTVMGGMHPISLCNEHARLWRDEEARRVRVRPLRTLKDTALDPSAVDPWEPLPGCEF